MLIMTLLSEMPLHRHCLLQIIQALSFGASLLLHPEGALSLPLGAWVPHRWVWQWLDPRLVLGALKKLDESAILYFVSILAIFFPLLFQIITVVLLKLLIISMQFFNWRSILNVNCIRTHCPLFLMLFISN
jgi:hypothetical protein